MICVADVEATSRLLQKLLGWKSEHGGAEFDTLVDDSGRAVLWLHDLDEHHHPRFAGVRRGTKGRGVDIYVQVKDLAAVLARVKRAKLEIVEAMRHNPNARFNEFTFLLPDGYLFTCCDLGPWVKF
jgi:hypothetical protein